jgi:hypothetical protein
MTTSPGAGPPSLRSLLAGAVAGNLRLVSRLNALVWERVIPPPAAAARSGPPDPLAAVLEAQLRSFSAAVELLGDLAGPPRRSRREETDVSLPAPVRHDAARGQSVTIPFGVENQYDQPMDIAFAADPLVARGQPAVPVDVVSFDPKGVTLPAGSHLVVRATIRVTERFAVGATYSTALRVREISTPPIRVELVITR